MNKTEAAKLARIRKKMQCSLEGCGKHFVFNVSEDYLTHVHKDKQRYIGTCSKCSVSIKLSPSALWLFEKHIGEPKFNINKTTFSDLFVDDDESDD